MKDHRFAFVIETPKRVGQAAGVIASELIVTVRHYDVAKALEKAQARATRDIADAKVVRVEIVT